MTMDLELSTAHTRRGGLRRRTRKACVRCNGRKVRCDVDWSTHKPGSQCTNCRLDGEKCVLREGIRNRQENLISAFMPRERNYDGFSDHRIGVVSRRQFEPEFYEIDRLGMLGKVSRDPSTSPFSLEIPAQPPPRNSGPGIEGHLIFSYLRFLKFDELSNLSPQIAQILERNQCLHVPAKPMLDEFVQEYFLHVHPGLPMIDEGRFWNMYHGTGENSERMPLLLLQAILFASCSYVPLCVVQKCGWRSIRDARRGLYERVKILYDFGAERDPFINAQATLLLAYYCTNSESNLNTSWLTTAIQHARAASAHRYDEDENITKYERKMRKRLWWCCIIRDRILSLGVRRPLQITSQHTRGEGLQREDFDEDMSNSKVYDEGDQSALLNILIALATLAVDVTDIITMAYPLESPQKVIGAQPTSLGEIFSATDKCRDRLIVWYQAVSAWALKIPPVAHASVTLFTSLMYIYYYSARLALCHYLILALETQSSALGSNREAYEAQLETISSEIKQSMSSMNFIVQNTIGLGLSQHLPISMVAYTALPLVLAAIDMRSLPESWDIVPRTCQDTYVKAMKQYEVRYDGTEKLSSMINQILIEAKLNSRRLATKRQPSTASKAKGWYQMLLQEPKLHLRVVLTLDLSLRTGNYPDDKDFPRELRADRLIEHGSVQQLILPPPTSPGSGRINLDFLDFGEDYGQETDDQFLDLGGSDGKEPQGNLDEESGETRGGDDSKLAASLQTFLAVEESKEAEANWDAVLLGMLFAGVSG